MSVDPVVFPAASTSASVSKEPTCASTYVLIASWVARSASLEPKLVSVDMPVTFVAGEASVRLAAVTFPVKSTVSAPSVTWNTVPAPLPLSAVFSSSRVLVAS